MLMDTFGEKSEK